MPKEKLNILLIDDDKEECTYFLETLQKLYLNFNLTYSADCLVQVYDVLDKNQIHLIFLDINLKEKDGIQFLKEIKSKENYRHIPVIMYTVSMRDEEIDQCYKLGAHYYMIKPYSEQNFLESLKKIFTHDWTEPQPIPSTFNFVINLAFA
jgi:CheY-like chemotaxis protein